MRVNIFTLLIFIHVGPNLNIYIYIYIYICTVSWIILLKTKYCSTDNVFFLTVSSMEQYMCIEIRPHMYGD
jgi:hypothetical protein